MTTNNKRDKEDIRNDFVDRFMFEPVDKVNESEDYEVVDFEEHTFRHVPTDWTFKVETERR